jgi:hypothetical protein
MKRELTHFGTGYSSQYLGMWVVDWLETAKNYIMKVCSSALMIKSIIFR